MSYTGLNKKAIPTWHSLKIYALMYVEYESG